MWPNDYDVFYQPYEICLTLYTSIFFLSVQKDPSPFGQSIREKGKL